MSRFFLALFVLALSVSAACAKPYKRISTAEESPAFTAEMKQWFENQKSKAGSPCCSYADGFMLGEKYDYKGEVRTVFNKIERKPEGYYVSVYDELKNGYVEVLVPNQAYVNDAEHYNPTGTVVVWFKHGNLDNEIYIMCFALASEN